MRSFPRLLVAARLGITLFLGAALVATALYPVAAGVGVVAARAETTLGRMQVGIDLAFPRFPERSAILAADGTPLARLFLDENRTIVHLRRVPEVARRAVLAIEDAGFYEHEGIDYDSILRATVANLRAGGIEQGASTISQQLARQVIPEVGRRESIGRKIREAHVALRLERSYSKDEILELYLNEVYFGAGAYGIGTAARRYFGKGVHKLDLGESALLAGLIAAPERWSPLEDRRAARSRRDVVLDRMEELGWAAVGEIEEAKAKPVKVRKRKPLSQRTPRAPYFVEFIKRQILQDERFGKTGRARERTLYQGGLEIQTTLQPDLQRAAQRSARRHLPNRRDPEAALASVDPRTGAIRAVVGGRDFGRRKFDLATQGRRQAGSAFKPFTLTAALLEGISPRRRYDSRSPTTIDLPGGRTWRVHNASGRGHGRIDLVNATTSSVNAVYAQLIMDVGPQQVARVAKRMGIRSDLPAVPSLALGTAPVTPLEMASAYGTLANGGRRCDPFAIVRAVAPGGEVLVDQDRGRCRRVLRPRVARWMVEILTGVIEGGTGTAANLGGRPVFGKTGTTDDYADAWFAGCAVQLCTATWVGRPGARVPMTDVHGITVFGGTFPARIWRDFMALALRGAPAKDFPDSPPFPPPDRPDPSPTPRETGDPSPSPSPEGRDEPEPVPSPEPAVTPTPPPPTEDPPAPDEEPVDPPDDGPPDEDDAPEEPTPAPTPSGR